MGNSEIQGPVSGDDTIFGSIFALPLVGKPHMDPNSLCAWPAVQKLTTKTCYTWKTSARRMGTKRKPLNPNAQRKGFSGRSMRDLCYAVREVQKVLRFAVYFACRASCVQGKKGNDYAECSPRLPHATLIEDETVAHFRNQNVQKHMVLAYCEWEMFCRTLRKREGAWPDLNPGQKYCALQVERGVANGTER